MADNPQKKPGFFSKAAEFGRVVSGANLVDCAGKRTGGKKCNSKVRPGYGGCGHPSCDSTWGPAAG